MRQQNPPQGKLYNLFSVIQFKERQPLEIISECNIKFLDCVDYHEEYTSNLHSIVRLHNIGQTLMEV